MTGKNEKTKSYSDKETIFTYLKKGLIRYTQKKTDSHIRVISLHLSDTSTFYSVYQDMLVNDSKPSKFMYVCGSILDE